MAFMTSAFDDLGLREGAGGCEREWVAEVRWAANDGASGGAERRHWSLSIYDVF